MYIHLKRFINRFYNEMSKPWGASEVLIELSKIPSEGGQK